MELLPLIQHIKSSYRQRHEYAIVAAFNADLRFFEQKVLSNLRARNVLFLIDEGQYRLLTRNKENVQRPRFAGIRYQVAPVSVHHGVFHSKFILCLSEKRSRLILGSGNMSRQGYMANAEIFSITESDNDQPDETTALIGEACNFLAELAQSRLVNLEAKEFIANALQVQPRIEFLPQRHHYFLHSLRTPIMDLVAAKLHEQKVTEIHVLAPFMGMGTQLLEDLISRFNHSSVNIYLQNNRAQFDPEAIASLCHRYPQVKLFEISAPNEDRSVNTQQLSDRYIHAKLLGFVTPKNSFSVTGSPNFTRAALGLSAREGNVETALFTQYESATDFKKLLKQQFLNFRSIDSLHELTPEPLNVWTSKETRHSLQIIFAKYEQPNLLIDFSCQDCDLADLRNFHIVCHVQGEDKLIPVAFKQSNTGHISVDCELPVASTIIWLEARKISDGNVVSSDRQWIFFPQVADFSETSFSQDDFERCAEMGGIEGIGEALRLASLDEQPDRLIAFLQVWNLSEILESKNNPVDNKPPINLAGRSSSPQLETRQEFLQRGLEILVRPDLEEVLQEILKIYRDRIIEWLGEAEVESVRMGLQYILVFDLLCLLLMNGFQKLIKIELEKKKVGLIYPQMQYGHMREIARRFVSHYLYDWENFLEKGNLGLYSLSDQKLPPHMYLFHVARAVLAYSLASIISAQIDLEKPVLFNKIIVNLIRNHAKERTRSYLVSPDGVEILKNVLLNYDIVLQNSGITLNVDQLRGEVEKSLNASYRMNTNL